MYAVVKERAGEGFVYKEVPDPHAGPGEVVVEVRSAGICGTDIPIFEGRRPVPYPLIPGHEFAGVIQEVGPDVEAWRAGDRVAVRMVIDCRECVYCRRGKESLCANLQEIGIHVDGAFARFVRVPARNVHRLPDDLSFEHGASIDPVASAFRPVKKAQIKSRDTVAIIGPGPIGLYALQLALVEGARRVVVLGTRDDRLQLARELGADAVIKVRRDEPVEALKDVMGGSLADVVIEAAGTPEAFTLAVDCAARGGKVILAGVFHEQVGFFPGTVVRKELTVKGSLCYTWQDFQHCLDLVADGRVRTDPIITHRFPLAEMGKALEEIRHRRAVKVIVHPT